jgi:hypothetical protein
VAESEFAMTESLVERYVFDLRLRTLDASQLAIAMESRNQGRAIILLPQTGYSARLRDLEGVSVINPEVS